MCENEISKIVFLCMLTLVKLHIRIDILKYAMKQNSYCYQLRAQPLHAKYYVIKLF